MKWLAVRSAALARASGLLRRPTCRNYSATAAATTSASDPLRILFCGSDSFSCAALNALILEKERNPGLIESLDVVVRPGKLSGRGMKEIRQVPLKMLAEDMKLPIHERDTFTGWQPDNNINLIIAVSFGLFVPPRLLNLAKYGGLNVHPSLLPDFRGPAPLQHTLLQRRTHTGVTLQTLHHTIFDYGTVLSQTPLPGIPIPENCTTQGLLDIVTPQAAEILVDGLRRGLHVPPLKDVGWKPEGEEEIKKLCYAPKLTKHDRQINWSEWNADDIVLRQRVLGPLWCEAIHHEDKKIMRMFLEHMQVVETPEHIKEWEERYHERMKGYLATEDVPLEDLQVKWVTWLWKPEGPAGKDPENWGQVRIPYFPEENGGAIFIPDMKGGCLRVPAIKVEGSRAKAAKKAIAGFGQEDDVEGSSTEKKGSFWDSAVISGLFASFLI